MLNKLLVPLIIISVPMVIGVSLLFYTFTSSDYVSEEELRRE